MDRILYSTEFGSRLFGTSTPSSDLDIKHIVLPDIQGLLIGKPISNKVVKTNKASNTKNGTEDVDIEFVPIQRFARDFFEGQTYALEIAFSIEGTHAGQTHMDSSGSATVMDPNSDFCRFVSELRTQFLTSDVRAMMGYVVNQANIYSFKGERLNCANAAFSFVSSMKPDASIVDAMADPEMAKRCSALEAEFPKYFAASTYEIGSGRWAPCFKLLEKTVPWSLKAGKAAEIVGATVKRYGQRAKDASADNVDWKATMHAVRIVDEGIGLLDRQSLALPLPQGQRARLLAIKAGKVPLHEIRKELDEKLDLLKDLASESSLPHRDPELSEAFDRWLESWMMKFYDLTESPRPTMAVQMKV